MLPNIARPLALLPLLLPLCQAVWPAPQEMTTGETTLFIDQTIKVTYNGDSLSYTSGYSPVPGPAFDSRDIVQGGISRAFDAIFRQNFVPWKLREHGSDFEPAVLTNKTYVKTLTINQEAADTNTTWKPLAGEVDESYSLEVTATGEASITAQSSTGVLRGLETFVQLFYQHTSGTSWYTQKAPITITDSPKYSHRGLLLDVARNWFPVNDILRTIDAMSWNKLNRIHLHITESQSWPLEVPALPELAEKGAYAKGLTYSPEDLVKIQEYAIHRGIEPIIEIDMPGHIGVVSLAYPELIVAYNELPYTWYCAQPPCGALKLNNTDVYEFLGKLFGDVLPRVSPYSAYFHSGGDEYNKNNSILDEGLKTNDSAVLQPMLQHFLDTVHGHIRDNGLVPMVWEEMFLDWNATLGEDVVIQSWLGSDSVKNLVGEGHKVIDSNYNFWYLDCGRGQWLNFDNGPSFDMYYPFNDWCLPQKNWRMMYTYDPREAAGVEGDEAELILGGEAALWTETIDPVVLDSLLWPRLGAVAEVLWSGRQDASGTNRTQFDAAPRLADMRERMVARGVGAGLVQMIFCTQASPEYCSI